MKKIIRIFIIVLTITGTCYAGGPLIIVRGQDFAPYHYLDKDKKEKGFIIEIINGTAQRMGLKISYAQYPWSRCMNMMKKGQADAMMNLFKTPERMEFMTFAGTVLGYETNTLFTLTDKNLNYSGNIRELTSYKIGTIRNYSYGKRFDSIRFPVNFTLETEQQLLNALLNQRCEVIIGNKLVFEKIFRARGLSPRIKALVPDVSKDPLFIAFSKVRGHETLAQSFSDNLKQFKTTREYAKILKSYNISLK